MKGRQTTAAQRAELLPARRRIAIRLTVQCLQGWRHGDPFLSRITASLERSRALRRQPWRQPVRRTQEPVSMLEKIRRFEARARAN
jgi:hypothetical protein